MYVTRLLLEDAGGQAALPLELWFMAPPSATSRLLTQDGVRMEVLLSLSRSSCWGLHTLRPDNVPPAYFRMPSGRCLKGI